jgi:FdhE protein
VSRPAWEQRIERAGSLAARYPASGQMMRFYQGLAAEQRLLYREFSGPGTPDRDRVGSSFLCLCAFVEREGSGELRRIAADAQRQSGDDWAAAILDCWDDTDARPDFLVRAFLQPCAEARCVVPADAGVSGNRCPACGRPPQAAVLRTEFDGLRRRLVCSLCHWEWDFRRILCPSCGETGFESLPAFRAEEYPHLRVDACETCKTYLLTIDAARDPEALALVDDLSAVALHLWAAEQGYRRLQANLFGV